MNKTMRIITAVLSIGMLRCHSIEAMVAGGFNPDQQLLHGAQSGDLAQVQNALEHGANIDAVDTTGCTALHYAVVQALPNMVKLLLDKGSDPTIRDTNGQTAAGMLALVSNFHLYQRILKYFDEALSSTSQDIMDLQDQVATLHY